MTPVRTQVLVKPFPSEEISEGGIFVPESAREINNKVRVVKVGDGIPCRPMKLKEGDVGFRVRDWGCEVFIDNELHLLMDMDAILAVE